MLSLTTLEEAQTQVDFLSTHLRLDVPVYFVCGRRDYNVPFELSVEYAEKLSAPRKEIVWFEHSAHLPNWEEPERFCDFCVETISRIRGLCRTRHKSRFVEIVSSCH